MESVASVWRRSGVGFMFAFAGVYLLGEGWRLLMATRSASPALVPPRALSALEQETLKRPRVVVPPPSSRRRAE